MPDDRLLEQARAGRLKDPKVLIGKVTAKKIEADTVLTGSVVGESLARVLPANIRIPSEKLRAVAIWVDPTQTAAGLVDAGDRVDVIAAHKLKIKTADGDIPAYRAHPSTAAASGTGFPLPFPFAASTICPASSRCGRSTVMVR